MTGEKVVFLAFKNDQLVPDQRDLMACNHCRNKAFAIVYQGTDAFPLLECTACHFHLGKVGWANDAQA